MRKSVLIVVALLFAAIVAIVTIVAPFGLATRRGAPVSIGNVVLGDVEYQKTGEVVVIPRNGKAVIRASDDGSWDSIVSASAGEAWRGVFIKDRAVTLSPYCMARYPVTQELFEAIMGTNPSYFKRENLNVKYSYDAKGENPDLRPADTVSWIQAIVFCNILTARTMRADDCVYYADKGCTKVYALEDEQKRISPVFNKKKKGYRLPTEAEWEFAARGGNPARGDWAYAFSGTESEGNSIVYDTNHYSFSDSNLDKYGWYRGNSNGVTHEVGTKLPNALGIYDMSGGVWEWLYDLYDNAVYTGKATNPDGARIGPDRVLRGGSWYDDAYVCAVSRRFHNSHPYIPHFYFGFRYCRSL